MSESDFSFSSHRQIPPLKRKLNRPSSAIDIRNIKMPDSGINIKNNNKINEVDFDLLFENQLQKLREINNEKSEIKNKNYRQEELLPKLKKTSSTSRMYDKKNPHNNTIDENKLNKKKSLRPLTSKVRSNNIYHEDFGKIPKYIMEMRKQAELKKCLLKKQKENEKYPKGTKLLSEEERKLTLQKLIQSKKDLESIFAKLPIAMDSLNIKNKKEKLLEELKEIDNAIDTFSKEQVFVKIDS